MMWVISLIAVVVVAVILFKNGVSAKKMTLFLIILGLLAFLAVCYFLTNNVASITNSLVDAII